MTVNASVIWSAVASSSSDNVTVGLCMTTVSGGLVVATDANMASSTTGRVDCIAITPAMPRQGFNGLVNGPLDKTHAPFVGAGPNTDFAVRNSLGRVVRSATLTGDAVGICNKDGSVVVDLTLGALTSLVVGGSSGILAAVSDGTPVTGDAIVTAQHASDPLRMTKATEAAVNAGFMPAGIALATIPLLGILLYAAPGSTIAASVIGLGAGDASWAVLSSTARVIRKKNPEASDVIIGEVTPQGNLRIWPVRPSASELVATLPPYNADNTGVADASDALRQMFADAVFTGIGLAYSCKPCRLPKGMYLLNKPINIQQRALRIFGEGEFTSAIRVQNYVGPAFYISAQLGTWPMAPAVMNGRQAMIFKHESEPRFVEWLVLSDDGAGTWYHGKSSFCVELKAILNTTTSDGVSMFICSFGSRATDDPLAEAFGCGYSGVGNGTAALRKKLFFTMVTTAGVKTVYTQNEFELDDSLIREIQWNWSGGFMRIFVGGVNQVLLNGTGSGVDTGALAGTIVQQSYESTMMGIVNAHFTTNLQFHSVDFRCCSIRGSDIARNTSNYTPNITNRYTNDSNTMFGLCMSNASDADDTDGIFVRGVNRQTTATAGAGVGYFPMRQDNVSTVPSTYDVVLEDFSINNIYGTCIQANASPQTFVRRMGLTGQNGLCLDANTFFGRVDALKIYPSNLARIGFRGAAALNTVPFSDIYIIGFDYGLVVSGGADIVLDKSIFIVACKKGYMLLISVSAVNAAGCDIFLTDENSAGAVPDMFFFLSAIGNSTFLNAVVAQAENPNAPVWTFSGTGTFGPTRHVFINTYLGAHPSNTGLMKFLPSCVGTLDLYHPFETAAVPRFRPGFLPPAGMLVTYHPDVDQGTRTIALADADRTVTREEHLQGLIEFTGALTANRTITIPAGKLGKRLYTNSTTGGFNLLIKLSGGAVSHTVVPAASATLWVNNAGTELVRST